MLSKEEILAELLKHSKGRKSAAHPNRQSISLIWEDGELNNTKAGSLLGQRTYHQFRAGGCHKELREYLLEHLPEKENGHAFIYCEYEVGDRLSKLVQEWAPVGEGLKIDWQRIKNMQESYIMAGHPVVLAEDPRAQYKVFERIMDILRENLVDGL